MPPSTLPIYSERFARSNAPIVGHHTSLAKRSRLPLFAGFFDEKRGVANIFGVKISKSQFLRQPLVQNCSGWSQTVPILNWHHFRVLRKPWENVDQSCRLCLSGTVAPQLPTAPASPVASETASAERWLAIVQGKSRDANSSPGTGHVDEHENSEVHKARLAWQSCRVVLLQFLVDQRQMLIGRSVGTAESPVELEAANEAGKIPAYR
ncbi:hypothetical protein DENSPDRAFT_679124 [Dentipellis sp. KUC8613]|nr:hypothetical protein DENSPDRAFT_679124 [Dentipellis sp. KUC8613]